MVVPRLAQQAERVAEQALELAKRRDNPPAGETPEQQAAREAELNREEALLEEERQRLADALDDLLNRRPEVLEAARKTALEQIAELSKEAANLADRQDALTESLKSDAQETAKAAAPIADKQAELLKKAEELQPAKPKENAPVNPVDPEALRKVLEELKAGNLDAASKQQAALADRLETLAKELKKNQALPKDPKQAAAELAKRQRELEESLAEAAKNQPAENATPAEKQTFENTLRQWAEKQTGIQSGIAQLEAPAANRKQQKEALDQAAKAVENLIKGQPKEASENASKTADALEQLAKDIKTPEERKAQATENVKNAAEEIAKRQNQAAEAAQQAADKAQKSLPKPVDRQQQEEQLAKRTEDVKRLPTGEVAKQQKQDALEALQKAGKAQEQLEELIKKQEQNAANNPALRTKARRKGRFRAANEGKRPGSKESRRCLGAIAAGTGQKGKPGKTAQRMERSPGKSGTTGQRKPTETQPRKGKSSPTGRPGATGRRSPCHQGRNRAAQAGNRRDGQGATPRKRKHPKNPTRINSQTQRARRIKPPTIKNRTIRNQTLRVPMKRR